MSLPTTVTNRAQGNNYVGATGMEFAVQTGFCIRTGFYITNSGSDTMLMSLSTTNNYEAFEFISGINEEVVITPGSTKLIPFNFKGIKDSSGPSNASGPEGTGNYTTYADLSFVSEADRIVDTTEDLIYPGQPRDGIIRVRLTGYVTGYYGRDDEFIPAHPEKFLGITGLRDDRGKGRNQLQWVNPATGYYFERYRLESGVGNTSNWSLVDYIEVPNVPVSEIINGTEVILKLYGDCTGINGANIYNHTGLAFEEDYYYRIRGEHYAYQSYSSNPLVYSDWVYCSGVSDFNQNVSDHVLTGLVSGSADLPAGGDPSKLKLSTTTKGAMEIYLEHNEEYRIINGDVFSDLDENGKGLSLKDRFDKEMSDRFIDDSEFFDLFTGVHFIMPKNIDIGSSSADYPAITVDYKDIESQELPINFYIREGARILGCGGKGGDGGVAYVSGSLNVNESIINQLEIKPPLDTAGTNSTAGSAGGNAMDIESNISKFKIFIHDQPRIYGGGGGGGGGDRIFSAKAAFILRQAYQLSNFSNAENSDKQFIENSIIKQIQELEEGVDGNALETTEYVLEYPLSGPEEGGSSETDQIDFDLGAALGSHQGGIGGGGQSFAVVAGGNKITFKNISLNYQVESTSTLGFYLNSQGTINNFGLGEGLNAAAKISQGGNGGEWGQFGNKAPNSLFFEWINGDASVTNLGNLEGEGSEEGKDGGAGGYSIYVQGGSNFTKSNFKEKLFDFVYDYSPSEIEGFIARWDAGAGNTQTKVKKRSDGTNASINGQEIGKWEVEEWNSNNISSEPYLDLNGAVGLNIGPIFYTSNMPISSFDRVRAFNNNNCITFEGKRLVFQNLCHGATSSNGGWHDGLDGFELFYVIWPLEEGQARNFQWQSYERSVYQAKKDQANPLGFGIGTIDPNIQRTLHKFSQKKDPKIYGELGKVNSLFYNHALRASDRGCIYESAGFNAEQGDKFMKFNPAFEQFYITQKVGPLGEWIAPAGAFIYNVSAERTSADSFLYTVGQDENIQSKIIQASNLEFDVDNSSVFNEARLGSITEFENSSFSISDIIMYNRKLTSAERRSVKNFLKPKAFHPYYLDNSMNNNNYRAGTPQQNNNKIRDGRGFAGLIRLNN